MNPLLLALLQALEPAVLQALTVAVQSLNDHLAHPDVAAKTARAPRLQ